MSSVTALSLNLDPEFFEACLDVSNLGIQPPPTDTAETIDSPTTGFIGKLSLSGDDVSDATRLTKNYSNAYSDFYGSGIPCVYKTGSAWPVREGPEAQGIVREARPVYGHPIGRTWRAISKRIYEEGLNPRGVMWVVINPFAYANEGEAKPFCPLIISIGVKPRSLAYDDAVAAAEGVKQILADEGFPDVEVAFVELVLTRSAKLLSFDPFFNRVPELRKPFTPALGVPIAPLKYPYYEGTGGLYLRLSRDDPRVVMLTCAHVARPLPEYPNTSMTYKHHSGQPREDIVSLGTQAYNKAIKDVMGEVGKQLKYITHWKGDISRLGDPVEGENAEITEKRDEFLDLVKKAERKVADASKLYNEVKYRALLEQRVIGFVLHSEQIKVSVDSDRFTEDWALIELYDEAFDWPTFKGNQVYVGDKIPDPDFGDIMFPQPSDRAGYHCPQGGLVKAFGVVQDAEIRNPQHLDVHGEKCLLVVKNGATTGTTIGRANGLESVKRIYTEYGINKYSMELAVLKYDKDHVNFSKPGDSGSVVLARDGRIVGIITGGAGPTDSTDTTYITPYWWLEKRIKKKFPNAFLYQVAA